jgi:hypothetical protein
MNPYELYGPIARAAIRIGDNQIHVVDRPQRHHDIIHNIYAATHQPVSGANVQGLATQNGQFVDRFLGLKIARHYDQIITKHPPEDRLFSEDMW